MRSKTAVVTPSPATAPFVNSSRFLSAIEHVSEHLLSKPYTITPMVDRWFFMLAEVEVKFANGQTGVIPIHGQEFVKIELDGKKVSQKDLQRINRFHSRASKTSDKEETMIREAVDALNAELKGVLTDEVRLEKVDQLSKKNAELEAFLDEKKQVGALYDRMIKDGKLVIDEEKLKSKYPCEILNINHRPNHDLNHSVRAAYYIKTHHAFNQQHKTQNFQDLSSNDLEKLQLMMLFSVVGRRDETGFNDGVDGCATYKSFRATSGREYLKYCRENTPELYDTKTKEGLDDLYRDALIVEMMGNTDVVKQFDTH